MRSRRPCPKLGGRKEEGPGTSSLTQDAVDISALLSCREAKPSDLLASYPVAAGLPVLASQLRAAWTTTPIHPGIIQPSPGLSTRRTPEQGRGSQGVLGSYWLWTSFCNNEIDHLKAQGFARMQSNLQALLSVDLWSGLGKRMNKDVNCEAS